MSKNPCVELNEILSKNILAFDEEGYNRKKRFHLVGRRVCQKIANAMGLLKGSYDIRSNKGGLAVSGEITLHNENLYLQISQSGMGSGYEIMFRRCLGRKDYTGGPTHWYGTKDLAEDFDKAVETFKQVANYQRGASLSISCN
jgi:hypothetical protein